MVMTWTTPELAPPPNYHTTPTGGRFSSRTCIAALQIKCLPCFTPNAAVLFVDVAIQPEVCLIAKQNSLMKIGNNGNLVLGPFDESTP
ncbi:hypothetical protein TNCV_802261 [Trichonephila clavipes]|nr:hypothetical protein TNCV_802261 [Trichonephila clavipes]